MTPPSTAPADDPRTSRAGDRRSPLLGLIDGPGAPAPGDEWISRIPARWAHRINSPFMAVMAQAPAGVRVATTTASDTMTVSFTAALITLPGATDPLPATLVAMIDGVPFASHRIAGPSARFGADGKAEIPSGLAQEWRLPALPAGTLTVELWLPHTALVRDVVLTGDRALEAPEPATRPTWVHYGSSISHCLEAESPTEIWPAIAARRLDVDVTSLAFAGSAMLDPFVATIIRDAPADLVSVKVGINLVNIGAAQKRTFRPFLEGFLDTIRDGHPGAPLVVCSPIFCPAVETEPGPTALDATGSLVSLRGPDADARGELSLAMIRDEIAATVAARRSTDPDIHHLDGLRLLGPTEGDLLVDGVHPGPAGYRLIGERFADAVDALFASAAPTVPTRG